MHERNQTERKVARAANQFRRAYIAGISHIIRTPMNAIVKTASIEHEQAMGGDLMQSLKR